MCEWAAKPWVVWSSIIVIADHTYYQTRYIPHFLPLSSHHSLQYMIDYRGKQEWLGVILQAHNKIDFSSLQFKIYSTGGILMLKQNVLKYCIQIEYNFIKLPSNNSVITFTCPAEGQKHLSQSKQFVTTK